MIEIKGKLGLTLQNHPAQSIALFWAASNATGQDV
jgi:hypothetical protein